MLAGELMPLEAVAHITEMDLFDPSDVDFLTAAFLYYDRTKIVLEPRWKSKPE
jgi:hypothetical protein